jgi:dTDP-4-dehydrorhamnose reductase
LLGSAIATEAVRQFDVFGISRGQALISAGWSHRSLDLRDKDATSRILEEIRPDVIVHCAAATDVEQCERDPAGTFELNVGTTEQLARSAARSDVWFVYVSTDSVFDGNRGEYREEDSPRPINEYARSKAEGEKVTLRRCPDALIVRTNFFGCNKAGRPNVGKWMHEQLVRGEQLPAFEDVRFSPLFVEDLAKLILELLARGAKGILHVAARDSCTKYEFAHHLGRALHLPTSKIIPTLLQDAVFRAKRPRDTSLCARKCEELLGREVPTVQEGITKFVEALAVNSCEQSGGKSAIESRAALNAH